VFPGESPESDRILDRGLELVRAEAPAKKAA